MSNLAPLNKGQNEAAEAFFTFLFSDEKEMGITGPGGVGKSYLMSFMIDDIMPRYFDTCKLMGIEPRYDGVQMTALTNKAAEVLAEFTKRPVETIHSFMNLKVTDDYVNGRSQISKTTMWRVHEQLILFIDECSMIDSITDRFIQEGTQNCKIVYVGDDKQMAPVMETISPIYQPGRMKWFELTEPMRTQIPEVLTLHKQLRETVDTLEFKPIQIIPGIINHLNNDEMEDMIKQTFSGQTHESRILAYTNKRVLDYNDYIRDLRQLPPEYTVGEFLVNNSAIRLRGSMLSVEQEVEVIRIGKEISIPIEDGVELLVRELDLQTKYGNVFTQVPVPVDKNHFSLLMNHYKRAKNWPQFFNLKNNYPDLRQRDAATVYKAQGSTHKTVFVDLLDISTCRNPAQAARMLYVALSRFKEEVFLFGNLSEKYGGLIW